jgi:ATP-dependent Clp protease, protease subunit
MERTLVASTSFSSRTISDLTATQRLKPSKSSSTSSRGNKNHYNRSKTRTTIKAGLRFGHDELWTPEKAQAAKQADMDRKESIRGLTESQIRLMGLSPEQTRNTKMTSSVNRETISARMSYRDQFPSDQNPPESGNMTGVTMMAGGISGSGGGPAGAPPDLPSLLLNARICYIGMSLVPAVTELVVAELLYLGYEQGDKPAYVYIHSAGSMGKDKNGKDVIVGVDNEAYAIIDTMRYIQSKIHTVAVGKTYGNAALILAAGDKGCRWALPNAQIATAPPRLNRTFNTSADVQIRANEVDVCERYYYGFMRQFTGKSEETIREDMGRTKYFTPEAAIEYGLIDKVITKGANIAENKNYELILAQQQAQQAEMQRRQGAQGAPNRG